jgi:hypothetical protein
MEDAPAGGPPDALPRARLSRARLAAITIISVLERRPEIGCAVRWEQPEAISASSSSPRPSCSPWLAAPWASLCSARDPAQQLLRQHPPLPAA